MELHFHKSLRKIAELQLSDKCWYISGHPNSKSPEPKNVQKLYDKAIKDNKAVGGQRM